LQRFVYGEDSLKKDSHSFRLDANAQLLRARAAASGVRLPCALPAVARVFIYWISMKKASRLSLLKFRGMAAAPVRISATSLNSQA
jgi:hypothetical protein